jgi:hypothetical protein
LKCPVTSLFVYKKSYMLHLTTMVLYTWPQGNQCIAHARSSRAGFRKFLWIFSMHRARGARAGLTVYPPSRTARFIPQKKAEVSKRQYSSKAKGSNVHDFLVTKYTVHTEHGTQVY